MISFKLPKAIKQITEARDKQCKQITMIKLKRKILIQYFEYINK